MRYLFRLCSALSVLLTVLPAHAGSNTLEMTVSTTITPSTCQATLHDNSGKANGIVDVGDVYISQIVNKTNSQAFSLVFSDCVGLAKKQATVTLTAKTGCDGASGGGNGFRNALNGSDDAANVSAEVWTTSTPASSGSKQLSSPARHSNWSIWRKPVMKPPWSCRLAPVSCSPPAAPSRIYTPAHFLPRACSPSPMSKTR